MIVQCPACKTKFRFDERQVTEQDGVWFRCSRCRHVFFSAPLLPPGRDEEEVGREEAAPEVTVTSETEGKRTKRWLWVAIPVLLIIVVLALLFSLSVPVDKIAQYIPVLGGKTAEDTSHAVQSAAAQIKIIDLRQHFVENPVLGKIRVVQGTAVNMSPKFMTRIKIKAELYDVLDVRVMESYSYCGNLLTDQELSTTLEEEIVKRLQQPLGTEVSMEKVPPQGMVPFMIVFLREPPGVAKTLVMPVDAEILLQ